MIRIYFFIILSLTLSFSAGAESKKITVSSAPLENITRLLTSQKSEIEVISGAGSCSHEYILKPSDFAKIQNSDVIIYISDHFETFMTHILKNSNASIINLSKKMNLGDRHNMHIWMSLENTKQIIKIIAEAIGESADNALGKIDELIHYKQMQLDGLEEVLLLSDSLEYLFEDTPKVKVKKLYLKSGLISARNMVELSKYSKDQCILVSKGENIESIAAKVGSKIIYVDSENWSISGYKKIINDIHNVCIP